MNQFKALTVSLEFSHIIFITETWLKKSTIKQVNGYDHFCQDREIVRGGGVAIYVRSDIVAHLITDINSNPNSELQTFY